MLKREQFIGPWAGLPVAWKSDLSYDDKTYRADIAACCEANVPGVYTGGTSGEFYAQEYDEFTAVADATIQECKNGKTPVMIGCTALHTLGVIKRARYAADKGADAIQVALPFWMEVPDTEVVRFFKDVSDAVPGMPMTIYETTRAKKAISLEQHKQIHQAVPAIIGVKSNANTLGNSPEGCTELSKMYNVFVGENRWGKLGPYGAIGCCSSFIYQNPRILLMVFELRMKEKWDELNQWMAKYDHMCEEGLKPMFTVGCEDSAIDRVLGLSAGFLKTSRQCRPPYPSCTEKHLADFRVWMNKYYPELMEL